MKITKVEQFITTVPHIPAIEKNRPGDYIERPIPIIKVHTDEGIYGLGEGGRGRAIRRRNRGLDRCRRNGTQMATSRRCLRFSGFRYCRQGTRRTRPQTDGRTALGEGSRRLLVVSDGARGVRRGGSSRCQVGLQDA